MKLVNKNEYGAALHTALRKCCDSTQTSIAYNLISEMVGQEWGEYVSFLGKKGLGKPKTDEDLAARVKELSLSEDWWSYNDRTPWKKILWLTFKLFTDTDWSGYASFLSKST